MPPTIYKQKGRPTFYLSYNLNKKRKVINTRIPVTKRALAEEFKKEFEAKLFLLSKNGSPQNRSESKTTLATEISNFITIYETTWSKGRLRNISSVLNMFKDIVGAETIVTEINLSHISNYISKRKEKVGITTLRSDLQIIRTLFNSLIDENIITRSPINKKLVPKPEHRNIIIMSDTEINTILDHAKNTDRVFYKYLGLLTLTGMRPGDLTNQNYGNINLAKNVMKISISKTNMEIEFPLYNELLKFIQDEFPKIDKHSPSELLFPDYKPHLIGRKFKRLKKSLDIIKEFDLKTFRKTFATKLIDDGVDGLTVAYLLGHKSVNTTAKYYINKNSGVVRKKLNETDISFIHNLKSANGLLTDC